ncbi:MAG: hypothetical protein LBQ15_11250 [Clostridium sp.]|nr:hypothetical protein [Clostridium sp.]
MNTFTMPKTDWFGSTDADGVYTGDRFDATDFNRIKNNLEYLRSFSAAMYDEFGISPLGSDRTPADYFYADEINTLEQNLEVVNAHTLNRPYGTSLTYYDNGNTMDFVELNRLESAIFDLYDRLTNQFNGRRMFTWNFGMKGGGL